MTDAITKISKEDQIELASGRVIGITADDQIVLVPDTENDQKMLMTPIADITPGHAFVRDGQKFLEAYHSTLHSIAVEQYGGRIKTDNLSEWLGVEVALWTHSRLISLVKRVSYSELSSLSDSSSG